MNISPAWAFLQFPVVNCVSPASAFRHQGQILGMNEENITGGENIWVDGEKLKDKRKCEVEEGTVSEKRNK
jgi:hypothetical protein